MSGEDPANARQKLAAEAERLKQQREDRKLASVRDKANAKREQQEEFGRSSAFRMSLSLTFPGQFWVVVGLWLIALFAGADGESVVAGVVAGLGLFVLLHALTANARYRRWKATLPFALVGFDELIGSGGAVREASLGLTFVDTPADADVLKELAQARAGKEMKVTSSKGSLSLLNNNLDWTGTNRPLAAWSLSLVRKVLLDVHKGYPLQQVTLHSLRQDEFYVPSGD
jgi:Flp pilus assembly protein TadB